VLELLHAAQLPEAGLAGSLGGGEEDQLGEAVLVAKRGGHVVGSAGVELYGDTGLLRSVAVDLGLRGCGIGGRLVEAALELAVTHGVREVFLLTEGAEDYFQRFGFRPFDRAEAPPAIRNSVEFASACPQSATLLKLELVPASR
jgi:amino-acid N-acetyltransferase